VAGHSILIFAINFGAKNFSWNGIILLASQRETAVERRLLAEKIPKGIRIVIDVENQL
jgi:hypothetical protein